MPSKSELRQHIRSLIRSHTEDELGKMSAAVCEKVYSRIHSASSTPSTVLLFWSLPDEVSTHELIYRLNNEGIDVFLPKVVGTEMEIRRFEGLESMTPGAFGIMEPEGPVLNDLRHIELALVPGVAFTSDCRRLGRGKGYYDRFLPSLDCPKIGVCFPFQIVEEIPCAPHDISMDGVISL